MTGHKKVGDGEAVTYSNGGGFATRDVDRNFFQVRAQHNLQFSVTAVPRPLWLEGSRDGYYICGLCRDR